MAAKKLRVSSSSKRNPPRKVRRRDFWGATVYTGYALPVLMVDMTGLQAVFPNMTDNQHIYLVRADRILPSVDRYVRAQGEAIYDVPVNVAQYYKLDDATTAKLEATERNMASANAGGFHRARGWLKRMGKRWIVVTHWLAAWQDQNLMSFEMAIVYQAALAAWFSATSRQREQWSYTLHVETEHVVDVEKLGQALQAYSVNGTDTLLSPTALVFAELRTWVKAKTIDVSRYYEILVHKQAGSVASEYRLFLQSLAQFLQKHGERIGKKLLAKPSDFDTIPKLPKKRNPPSKKRGLKCNPEEYYWTRSGQPPAILTPAQLKQMQKVK